MERLQSGLDTAFATEPITDIMKSPLATIIGACDPLGLQKTAEHALAVAKKLPKVGSLNDHEKGTVYIYTGNSLYWRLKEALRSANRAKVKGYVPYLRLFIQAHGKIPVASSMQL